MVEWISTKIPKDLYHEIEKFIQSEKGKELGFTSKTAFITHAVRDILNAYHTGAVVKAIDFEKNLNQNKKIEELEEKIEEIHVKYAHALANPLDSEMLQKIVFAAVEKQMKKESKKKKS